ncbi:hypothetical protein PINS_up014539 [Pythium insidiosum]|nr:hypothetical protein PINS_up014539 [Pythium insidiosum]
MEQVALLIQEWLTIAKFSRTLPCFVDECKERGLQATSVDKWVELTALLDLSRLQVDAQVDAVKTRTQRQRRSLLDVIVAHTFVTHRRSKAKALLNEQSQRPPTVFVSKRPHTAKDAHSKFVAKRLLPTVGGSSLSTMTHSAASKSVPSLPSHGGVGVLRPKSAIVCKSTSELIAKTSSLATPLSRVREDNESQKETNNSPPSSPTKPSSTNKPVSPIKSSNGRGHSPSPSSSPSSKPESPSKLRPGSAQLPLKRSLSKGSNSSGQDVSASSSSKALDTGSGSPSPSRTSSRPQVASGPTRKLVDDGARRADEPAEDSVDGDGDGDGAERVDGDPETAFQPVLELEEMNEERLADHFSSLSRGTIKKLRRVLAKSSAHSQELERCRRAMEQIQLKAKQQEKRSMFAAEQTELLSSTMDMIIKEPCSLCRYVFLKRNLTTKVTYKSICDLRASWAAKKREEERRLGPPSRSDKSLLPSREERTDDDGDDAAAETNGQLMDSSQISHLYDEVPVCVFCAQLLLDVATYRPTSAQLRQRREEKRRESAERHRQRELQRQMDALRCDPLDFDVTRLNSDDDGSDTEEVLEYDDDGRVRVIRRQRLRRVTRIPAQRGLVSKRLHYDQLRSQSVHALNRKEWGVIAVVTDDDHRKV